MSDVLVTSLTSGVPVAAETIGTTAWQKIKVFDGATGGTTGWSIPGGVGLVSVVPGAAVQVSGAVSVSAMPAITGNVAVSGVVVTGSQIATSGLVVWLAPSQTMTVAGIAVANTVNVSSVTPVTTQTSVSVSGIPVWFNPGALVSISGTGVVSIVPGVSVTISGQTVSVAPGVSVTIQQGVSVSLPAVSGVVASSVQPTSVALGLPVWIVGGQTATGFPVQVSVSGIVPVTTAVSVSVSAMPVWLNPTQQVVVSGLVGVSVNALVTGVVSVSAMPGVSIVGIVPVTTAVSVSVSALPVWLNPTQQVVVSGLVGVSVTVSGQVVTNTGVQPVSVSGVIASSVPATSVALGLPVWIVGGQTATGFPVQVSVSGVVGVTTAVSVSVTGLPVWLNPTQTVALSGVLMTTTATSGVTGPIVWLGANQVIATIQTLVSINNLPYNTTGPPAASSTVLGVISKDYTRIPFAIVVSSTIAGVSTTYLMTIYTANTLVTTGASFWVPGSRVRVVMMNAVAVSSAVLTQQALCLLFGTAAASLSVTATVGIGAIMPYFPAATSNFNYGPLAFDGPPGATTVALGNLGGTSHTLQAAIITGYLFAISFVWMLFV